MATMTSNTSALIVTAPKSLSSEQVDQVRAEIARQLPADTVVLVIQPGFTVHPLSFAPTTVELQADQADLAYRQLAALGDLQKIAADISAAIEVMGSAVMRVAP